MQNIRNGVLLIGANGQCNYGDELIAASVVLYHQSKNQSLILNTFSQANALTYLSQQDEVRLDGVKYTDMLWQTSDDLGTIADAISAGENAFKHKLDQLSEQGFESLAAIHFHGGGYINSMWPRSAFSIGFALAMKRQFGIRLIATGMGLMPLKDTDASSLAKAICQFDHFECRDLPSTELMQNFEANVIKGADDAFLNPVRIQENKFSRPDLYLCLQLSELTEIRAKVILNGIYNFILRNSNEINRVIILEFFPHGDNVELLSTFLAEAHDKIIIKRFNELSSFGLSAKVGDFAIVTRFHAHLILCRSGVRGVFFSEEITAEHGNSYYDVKHSSLIRAGSNWVPKLDLDNFDLDDFPPIPDFININFDNEKRKQIAYKKFFND